MLSIDSYMNDGADWQSQAILAYVRAHIYMAIDKSYYQPSNCYFARVKVGRYENCREQGYVFKVTYEGTIDVLNLCVYQHRNCERICILVNNAFTINTPTIEDMWKGKDREDKDFQCGEIVECGEWLIEEMRKFIEKCVENDAYITKK